MHCEACGANLIRPSASSLCPACQALTRGSLPLPRQRGPHAALWLWISDNARIALASGDLATIVRAYRAATGVSQRQLAERLGYDPTYISMIETGRREINDVATRRRIAQHLGIPPHTLGIIDPDDADFSAMLQFGESTIRLAILARQAGHGAEAVNELWPLVTRLETRLADGQTERDVLHLLARARAELGVSLGYVLPEERLPAAARWTGRALWLAERLDDQQLHAFTLRVHGNELRKIGHTRAAVARLQRAAQLVSGRERASTQVQLARATAELGAALPFDQIIEAAARLVNTSTGAPLASPYALHEVHLRGLMTTGRPDRAVQLLNQHQVPVTATPPQWQAILQITIAEAFLVCGEISQAAALLQAASDTAERHRLPHQVQRVIRVSRRTLPEIHKVATAALHRLAAPTRIEPR